MEKLRPIRGISNPRLLLKIFVIMKLSIVLILLGVLNLKAGVYAQGSITLNMGQAEIEKVLSRIENQGEYRFLYNFELPSLKKKVDANFQQTTIQETLNRLFVNTDLTYKILENNLVVVISTTLENQDIRITGKITGTNGEPLSGVSIAVKGMTRGVNSDNDGSFTITVAQDAVLVVSYIGYESKEVKVNNQSVVNIQLQPSNKTLDQVVVMVQKKEEILHLRFQR
jgi:hypothetical protein